MLSKNVDGKASGLPRKKGCPARGKRYSKGQKEEILEYAKANTVEAAAAEFNVTETSIYEWRRALKRRGRKDESPDAEGKIEVEDQKLDRDQRIIGMWRQHPGYGPSQVRNMLKRGGFKVSVGTARHVMEENGYLPPTLKRKEHVGRYEAGRPRELYHLDFYHFYVHKQKQCVLFIEDDYSRFIASWAMAPAEKADPVIESIELAIQRYGKPDGVMSDRGSAFHSWKGLSRFEALLEDYEINYYLAKEASVNGKVEALNASFQKECVEQNEFMDLTDAARAIGRWVEHYNHRRTHHGLGGLLVPADRFYGVAEQTVKKIEQGLGADTAELTSPDSRGLDLFRVVSYGGKPQIWLMGEKIFG
ncbi:integrase core domain-containing protein [Maridesulfovibrio ferrireducens]|uniref:integrase core domain-containing protein n=1 Tax=Maridesulfovibrio ferrireducens TaxID=246191 RepID=UPI001A33E92F|nr:integrase core domain-containing protein [Maridesulfovibrio ferrireducens]MBI9113366.1 transposase [Maridesulfovibrio ferrireducens]